MTVGTRMWSEQPNPVQAPNRKSSEPEVVLVVREDDEAEA
jgi:hypothetical protein